MYFCKILNVTALILSVIILMLSCMPCTDGFKAMSGKAKQEIAKTSHQQDSHSKTDACSPFCSCSCCTSSPVPQMMSELTLVKPQLTKKDNPFYSSLIKGILLSIWQPPQLA